jgi:hypothetical protein
VTFSTSSGSDVGNGKISATADATAVITPVEVRQTSETTQEGKRSANATKPRPLVPAVRDALTALLPKLPTANARFSISPYVDDEGWHSSRLVVVRDGKRVEFELVQGKQAPPVPAPVDELRKLVVAAIKE